MSFETISVIGLGYIGLPTAAMFASCKKHVIGVDVNRSVVDTINRGEIHIVEPHLDKIVESTVADGFLRAVMTPAQADAFLIAVPTPFKDNESDIPEPDLSYIEAACTAIAPVLKKGDLVILESTSPVGSTEQMADWLASARVDLSFPQYAGEQADVKIAHCPERVLPGQVVRELVENDRIIGGMTPACSRRAAELYGLFVNGDCLITSARTAEMAKLTENASRDVQIAFANELSMICDELDINVWELIKLANCHPRVNILQPGPGVGGHCIAIDPWFIISSTPTRAKLLQTARKTNNSKPHWVIEKIRTAISTTLSSNPSCNPNDISIACYGLSFKPDIDDLRESPALQIVEKLSSFHTGPILIIEPNIDILPTKLSGLRLVDFEWAKETADIHVMLVDHSEFKRKSKPTGTLLDFKGIWENQNDV